MSVFPQLFPYSRNKPWQTQPNHSIGLIFCRGHTHIQKHQQILHRYKVYPRICGEVILLKMWWHRGCWFWGLSSICGFWFVEGDGGGIKSIHASIGNMHMTREGSVKSCMLVLSHVWVNHHTCRGQCHWKLICRPACFRAHRASTLTPRRIDCDFLISDQLPCNNKTKWKIAFKSNQMFNLIIK